MQNVFIVGSKGIPSAYGGYETFVDKLTEYHQAETNIRYHVACRSDNNDEFEYHNARCFNVKVPPLGSAQAIYYDVTAIKGCIRYIKENDIKNPIVYILACRIGPFMSGLVRKIHKLGGVVYVNPDGHEWKRAKWSAPVRKYWKMSERMMVKRADLLICDSRNIEEYIKSEYSKYNPKTTFIAYGCDTVPSAIGDDTPVFTGWLKEKGLRAGSYYLAVGRFVPENNYETLLREFMASDTDKDFALITNVSERFLEELKVKTGFDKDKRIKFVGTVYDKELLKKIRENAYGYFHGHEVGGTNPSLIEALGYTKLNMLFDVCFNREVGEDAVLYWNKQEGNLAGLIEAADNMSADEIEEYGRKAKARMKEAYSWEFIAGEYKNIWSWNHENIGDTQLS